MSQQVDEIYAWLSDKPEQRVTFIGEDNYAILYYRMEEIDKWIEKLEYLLENPPE